MTQDEVVTLMRGSKTEDEWNANCDAVKAAHKAETGQRGYPDFWYPSVVMSGVMSATAAKFTKESTTT